ncbi:hypothetical protein EAI30_13140 [Romboutsia ilealis]|uniref:DUF3794 domain-containing protein n=1 Tax=Romboutsia faecis TaxID=2764597 RepID=A0ABR7JTB9_9FIRM|nr:hypothetical protein [Romboutsia faecis]MBC5997866.1 hypothetical protein [Romboutsia faecis]MRN25562.1 hypothetical protein [Romboutsia ilealis]
MDIQQSSNIIICPFKVNKILDSTTTINKLSSNLPIKFDILDNCTLPCNARIEILESKLEYDICKINKEILVNGHKLKIKSSSLKSSFYIDKNYVNIIEESCNDLLLNITECLNIEFQISVRIKAVAHVNKNQKISIEALGKTNDSIQTILISNVYVPNYKCNMEKVFIDFENGIKICSSPEYIFLSPIYDYNCNMNAFLGNVFLNYCINLNLLSLLPTNISLFKRSLENKFTDINTNNAIFF